MEVNRQHAQADKDARKAELRQKAEERRARIEAVKAAREQKQAEREALREVRTSFCVYLSVLPMETGSLISNWTVTRIVFTSHISVVIL